MKTVKTSAALAALCCLNASMLVHAAPTSPSLTVPAIPGAVQPAVAPTAAVRPVAASAPSAQNAPSAAASLQPAPSATTAVAGSHPVPSPAIGSTPPGAQPRSESGIAAPDRRLTLGDWEDLGERRAYKAQLEKINGTAAAAATAAAPAAPAMPPMPALPQMIGHPGAMESVPEKKRPRFSEACPDDDRPCFFSVYGLSMEDGTNNYRGQLAIKGRLVPGGVYKGKKFDGYTVTEITGSELTVVDRRGRKHVWPLYSAGDYAADPKELTPERPANQSQLPATFPAVPFPGSVR